MSITFNGSIHPAAEAWRLMDADELASLAEDIGANGLLDPIILTFEGFLVDGRNRLKACEIAGITPTFTVLDEATDPYMVVVAKNERKNHSTGQQAMGRALIAAAAGRRKAGRWERGTSVNIKNNINDQSWRDLMKQAGVIIDTAEKAKHYEVGNGITQENLDTYVRLPEEVRDGIYPISAAYKRAEQFEAIIANAEAIRYEDTVKWLNQIDEIGYELTTKYATPPNYPTGPTRRQDIEQATTAKKQLQTAVSIINEFLKGIQK